MWQGLLVRIDSEPMLKSGEITLICALHFEMDHGSLTRSIYYFYLLSMFCSLSFSCCTWIILRSLLCTRFMTIWTPVLLSQMQISGLLLCSQHPCIQTFEPFHFIQMILVNWNGLFGKCLTVVQPMNCLSFMLTAWWKCKNTSRKKSKNTPALSG